MPGATKGLKFNCLLFPLDFSSNDTVKTWVWRLWRSILMILWHYRLLKARSSEGLKKPHNRDWTVHQLCCNSCLMVHCLCMSPMHSALINGHTKKHYLLFLQNGMLQLIGSFAVFLLFFFPFCHWHSLSPVMWYNWVKQLCIPASPVQPVLLTIWKIGL